MLQLFKDAWQGTASLAKAFWLVFFLFGIVVKAIVSFIVHKMAPGHDPVAMMHLTVALAAPYSLFSAICVWRCAKNSAIFWNLLAKFFMILVILSDISAIIHALALR